MELGTRFSGSHSDGGVVLQVFGTLQNGYGAEPTFGVSPQMAAPG